MNAASALVDDADEAEDVMQDAYVRAYVNLRQFAGRAKFSSWLTRIAVHEALARARRRGRIADLVHGDDEEAETDSMDRFPSSGPRPAEQVLGREVRDLLEKAVSGLAPIYRSVFVLREVEGLSVAETAASLGIREEAVKVRLHRARAMLRDDLLERAGRRPPRGRPGSRQPSPVGEACRGGSCASLGGKIVPVEPWAGVDRSARESKRRGR
ncbi:MAG: sigma-70 family RNA polymerase sigma factor [Acidobacteriia bacterium]|nr:sigma-70 family RNA polymerase sigma factor [Terriglobia bacterium]